MSMKPLLRAARLAAFAAALLDCAAAAAAEVVVRAETVEETKAVFGQVESRNVVPARARIGGTIREISVSEGSEVEQGQVIAVVIDEKLALQRDAAVAQAKAFGSQLANAQTEFERAQQLLARGAAPQSRVDTARTHVEVLTSQLAAAEASRAVVEQQTREGDVLAPASGRILQVPVTAGAVILPGEEIATVAGGGYFLRLLLPERHAAEIVEGDTVMVGERALSPAGNGHPAVVRKGQLVKVYPEIANGRVVADVEVEGLGDYFVGERTLVWIPVGRRETVTVAKGAVSTRYGVDYVKVATEAGPIDVAVILGESFADAAGERVEILSGVRDGDRVIVP